MRKDPDPFDERHPYRTDPSCQFGFLLKQLFRKDHFMSKVILSTSYYINMCYNLIGSSLPFPVGK